MTLAAPLHALSCAPHGVDNVLHKIKTSPDGYVAAVGTLSYNPAHVPKSHSETLSIDLDEFRIKARFKGKTLGRSGFKTPVDSPVTIELSCFNGWCAFLEPDRQVLAFLKVTPKGYTLAADPCGSDMFFDPKPKMLKATQDCYLRGKCPPKPRF
ncbi:MAG: hypothetical protein AAF891_01040 [Pseudomonadota bacterium]